MLVTVGDVLELEPLRRAGARVLAGAANLSRPVRWVHVAELPDIAHLLEGGELLLTTGLVIAGNPAVQRRYVDELADAGAAGVIVELGRTFHAVPADMVEAADRRGLPLVALAHESRFVEVTEVVHREILSRQYARLDRAERVSRALTDQILDGADVGTLVAHLGAIFGSGVVFEDAAHRVAALSGPDGEEAVTSAWERHAALDHDGPVGATGSAAVRRAGGSEQAPGCTWVDIWIRHGRWGRLHVLERTWDLGTQAEGAEQDELLVDRAGAALALSLLAEKDAAHLAERAGDALIGELVAGRHGPVEEVVRRAKRLGADLESGPLVVVALELRPGPGTPDLTAEERLETLRALAEALRSAVVTRGCSALVGESGDRVLAVVAVPAAGAASRAVEEVVEVAVDRAVRRQGVEVVVGASGEATLDGLGRAVEEAAVAAGFGRNVAGGRRVHHFTELGTYQLLVRLAEGPELARFVDSELRPLLERDRAVRPRLIPTLRAYLRHAGRRVDAARELGIQRRTLYQRMARIESLLGRDVDDQTTRTRLTLAIQGLDYLADRTGRP